MLLKKGSNGESVKQLQTRLGVNPTGFFGTETEAAVIKWQKSHGLLDDGIVGDRTWLSIFPAVTSINAVSANNITVNTADIVSRTVIELKLPLNLHKLKGVVPNHVIQNINSLLKTVDSNLNSELRLAHFLSQCAHESSMFTRIVENLNYSESGLLKVFPKYFTAEEAKTFAMNPEAIANRVYARRMGNGNEASGDGWKYRGRGYIQLTGKSVYKSFANFVNEDVVEQPELVSSHYALESALYYFDVNNIWKVCDKGSDEKTVIRVSKTVNGGTIGIESRLAYFIKFYNLLRES